MQETEDDLNRDEITQQIESGPLLETWTGLFENLPATVQMQH